MQKHIFSMRKHKLTFSPVPASSMQKARICPIESVFWPPSAARGCRCPPAGAKGDRTPYGFYPSSPISAIYLTNCTLSFPCDTNFTPKCSHSLQQFCCVLLLRTENVNVGVVCCRNIRMAKPLAHHADRYTRFQRSCSERMPQLMQGERLVDISFAQNTVQRTAKLCIRKHFAVTRHQYRIAVNTQHTINLL